MRKSGRERKGVWKHKKSLNCPADVWTLLSVLFFFPSHFFPFFPCHGHVCSCSGLTSAFGWVTIVFCPHPAEADFLSLILSLRLSVFLPLSAQFPSMEDYKVGCPMCKNSWLFHFSLLFMDNSIIWLQIITKPTLGRNQFNHEEQRLHDEYTIIKTLVHCTTWISWIIRDSDSLLILLIIFSDMSLELVSS